MATSKKAYEQALQKLTDPMGESYTSMGDYSVPRVSGWAQDKKDALVNAGTYSEGTLQKAVNPTPDWSVPYPVGSNKAAAQGAGGNSQGNQPGASGGSYGTYSPDSYPDYAKSAELLAMEADLRAREGAKPGEYASKYGDQIDELLNKILNREDFSYDFNADPLYQQYKDAYTQQGKLAMMDTMGNAAALSGGYGNSYAQTVGQQAYQQYLQGLNDVIPELRNTAYQMYSDKGDKMTSDLGILRGMDETDYGRYQDDLNDYYNDLNYYFSKYNTMSDQEYQYYLTNLDKWMQDRDYYFQREQWEAAQAAAAASSNGSYGGGSEGGGGSNPGGGDDPAPTAEDKNAYTVMTPQQAIEEFNTIRQVAGGEEAQKAFDYAVQNGLIDYSAMSMQDLYRANRENKGRAAAEYGVVTAGKYGASRGASIAEMLKK